MAFTWKDYLEFANEIYLKDTKYEEELRERLALSRSYYAAFCYARDYAVLHPNDSRNPYSPSTGDEHTQVRSYYECHKNNTMHSVAILLSHMRKWRNNADYEIPFNSSLFVQESLDYADEIFQQL